MRRPAPVYSIDMSEINKIDVWGNDVRQNSLEFSSQWSKAKPFYFKNGDSIEVLCGRYEDVRTVYVDPELFSAEIPDIEGYERFNKTMGVKQLSQTEGEQHARLRKLMTPAFAPRSVKTLTMEITNIVDEMLEKIAIGPNEFDAMADFSDELIVRTLLTSMFKLNEKQRSTMLEMAEILAGFSNLRHGEKPPENWMQLFGNTKKMIEGLISTRRATPGDDFISSLIVARDEQGALSDEELFDQVFMVCIAALTTTPTTMGGILYTLFTHPDQLADLKANPDLAGDAVDECQRYHGHRVVGAFPRFATRDTVLGGTKIYRDMPVHVSILAAHHDPAQYENPGSFNIRRKPRGLLAFGTGVHLCMGTHLSKLVLAIALSRYMEKFPNASLADPDFTPLYVGGAGGRRIAALPMVKAESR